MKKNTNILILAFIFFIGLIITYSNHFNNGFHFDDSHTIQTNVYITSLKNIPAFFYNPMMFSSMPSHWGIRPIITTSLAIDYWMGNGLNPFYFHLSTFIWYILMCVMLFFVYKKIYSNSINHIWTDYFAIFAVAWYAMHTANAETVNYIISRSDILSTFFVVASFSVYVFYPNLRKFGLFIIPAVLGVFCKETLIVLPVLLFFYYILFEKNLSISDLFKKQNIKTFFNAILFLMPVFVAIAIFQGYTVSKAPSFSTLSNNIFYYALTQTYIWVHYFLTFFIPMNLSADTDWSVISNPFDDRIIIGLSFVTLLIYTIFKTSNKRETKPIAFGLIWFVFTLLPTSIIPLSEVMNDHRIFFPYVGLVISVVYSIGLLILKFENKLLKNKLYLNSTLIISLLIIGAYAYGAHQRNKVWKDEETLWKDVTVKSPMNGRGLMNYGLTQMAKGNYSEALQCFEKAQIYTPYYYCLFVNIGILKNAINKPIDAEENFKKALMYGPGFHEPYMYYANFLRQHNRLDEARQMAEKCVSISPSYLEARYSLMEIYNDLGLWDNLNNIANQTLSISSNDPTALKFIAASQKKQTKLDEIVELAKNSPSPENYLNLSLAYYSKGMYDKCIEACNEALKLRPNYAEAYNNICSSYNVLGKFDEAKKACEKAIQLKPDFQLAKNNLAVATSKLK